MALQIVKQGSGYKVVAEVNLPQTIEKVFEDIEDALASFKEFEQGGKLTEPELPIKADETVEPGV